jgi:hypothetical protein
MAIEIESSPFALLWLILAGVCVEVAQSLPLRPPSDIHPIFYFPSHWIFLAIRRLVILVDIEFVLDSRGTSIYYVPSRPEAYDMEIYILVRGILRQSKLDVYSM